MGIWVVVLEAVAGQERTTIGPDDLDALADALAANYPQVIGGPSFFQAQFWVEEATAGAAVMLAQRLWQSAVREVGLPPWDVVRAEARDAHAIEAGLIEWSPETDEDEFEPEEPEEPVEPVGEAWGAGVDAREVAGVEAREVAGVEAREVAGVEAREVAEVEAREMAEVEAGEMAEVGPEVEPYEEGEEEPVEVPTGGFDLGDQLEEEPAVPILRPHLRAAAEKRAAARRAGRKQGARKRATTTSAAPKKLGAKKPGPKKLAAEKLAAEKSGAKKLGRRGPGARRR